MEELLQNHPGSLSIFIGILFFIILTARFNHRLMRDVPDQTAAILCVMICAMCGAVVATAAYILIQLFW